MGGPGDAADALLSRIDAADALRALECAADPLMTGGVAGDAREFLYGAADPLRDPGDAADALCIEWFTHCFLDFN